MGHAETVRGVNEKQPEKNLESDGYAHYPDCGDLLHENLGSCHSKHMQIIICQLHLSKEIQK